MADTTEIIGSGVFVDRSGIVLTARHVLDELIEHARETSINGVALSPPLDVVVGTDYRSHVGAFSSKLIRAKIERVWCHPTIDIAFLKLHPDACRVLQRQAVKIAARPCEEGDRIWLCGYPAGSRLLALHRPSLLTPSLTDGIVSAVLPHPFVPDRSKVHFRVAAFVHGGSSGGPVIDSCSGELAGIVTQVIGRGSSPSGFAYAVHAFPLGDYVRGLKRTVFATEPNKTAS